MRINPESALSPRRDSAKLTPRNRPEVRVFRIGSGHDSHRLVAGRPLVLGGVTVPHTRGLDGHSDADVVLHALTDALLGAVAAGDIGELFPDTDPANKDADSRVFLRAAARGRSRTGLRTRELRRDDFRAGTQARPE